MTTDPPNEETIRALVRQVLLVADFPGRAELLTQASAVEYRDGPVTMMDLWVPRHLPPAKGVASPTPNLPNAFNADGEPIGVLVLWLSPDGYIDCLEYGWYTDEMPIVLPDPALVRR